jgi:hypothetical protein
LWLPIPGIQTLNFKPYRVNLTPFAGLLSNGQPHTVSLSVYNADSYFSATASLLLYLDSGTTQITGAVTQNTLTAPSPVVTENLNVQPTYIRGTVDMKSNRTFTISGYANTSRGKVTTKVTQTVDFNNNQYYNLTNTVYLEDITLGSSVSSTTTTSGGGAATTVESQTFNFPMTMDINEVVEPDGDLDLTTNVIQNYTATVSTKQNNVVTYTSSMVNTGQHKDTIDYNTFINQNQSASQQYNYWDSTGASYLCDLSAAANVLTYFSSGCAQ